MRRVLTALLAAAAGTALLVGLKSKAVTPPAQPVADAPLDPSRPASSGAPAATAQATPAAATPAAPVAPNPPPPATRTIAGAAYPAVWEGDDYGDMQVKIVVTGTHIDQVVTVKQSNRPKNVASVLGAKAVQMQSANVGNVSGATASSAAYKKSLQSAIDKI